MLGRNMRHMQRNARVTQSTAVSNADLCKEERKEEREREGIFISTILLRYFSKIVSVDLAEIALS